MTTKSIPPGFHSITRRDGIFQERIHDTYKAKGKFSEPTICSECGAVFHKGRWQWLEAPTGAHLQTCPACHRIHDHYPAGFVTLEGSFFLEHREEIKNLVHNFQLKENVEHPLKRIMAIEENDNGTMLITTTDIHLARGIGEAIHNAYQGKLEFHYNPEEALLRVHWFH